MKTINNTIPMTWMEVGVAKTDAVTRIEKREFFKTNMTCLISCIEVTALDYFELTRSNWRGYTVDD